MNNKELIKISNPNFRLYKSFSITLLIMSFLWVIAVVINMINNQSNNSDLVIIPLILLISFHGFTFFNMYFKFYEVSRKEDIIHYNNFISHGEIKIESIKQIKEGIRSFRFFFKKATIIKIYFYDDVNNLKVLKFLSEDHYFFEEPIKNSEELKKLRNDISKNNR